MTADRKASLKGSLTMAFSGLSFAGTLWVGVTLAQIDRVLTYSVSVEDIKDWSAESERMSTNGLRFASFSAIWQANHQDRAGVIRRIP